jgi:hypothetical protein
MNRSHPKWTGWLAALWLGALVFGLQWQSGAYQTGFGAHPDEAAHYVTTLMVHDYLAAGFPGHPLNYAQNYYEHYPKVALGHYPPGFYAVAAAWMLVFSESRPSTLIFLGMVTVALSWLLFRVLERQFGSPLAFFGATIFVLLPLSQQYTYTVMADMLVALGAFAALLCLGRFLEHERVWDAVWFGLIASFTIMVKTSGLWLAPLPVLGVLFLRKPRLMLRPRFWIPAVLVGIICLPWLLFTYKTMASGMADTLSTHYVNSAVQYFGRGLFRNVGVVLLLLGLYAIFVTLLRPLMRGHPLSPLSTLCALLSVTLVVFHLLVPVGLETRYLLPVIAPLVVLAISGMSQLQSLVSSRWTAGNPPRNAAVQAALGVVIAIVASAEVVRFHQKHSPHFAAFVSQIAALPPSAEVLISSDARGEGAFIAEIAMNEPRPTRVIRRASKILASSDWMGRDYAPRSSETSELLEGLHRQRIGAVVTDQSIPPTHRLPHHDQLENAIAERGSGFAWVTSVQSQRASPGGELQLWKLGTSAEPPP